MNTPETPIGGSLKPVGSETSLDQCPPGLFMHNGSLGLMTEYSDKNGPEAYVVASGEYFWGGTNDPAIRILLRVVPMEFIPNDQAHA